MLHQPGNFSSSTWEVLISTLPNIAHPSEQRNQRERDEMDPWASGMCRLWEHKASLSFHRSSGIQGTLCRHYRAHYIQITGSVMRPGSEAGPVASVPIQESCLFHEHGRFWSISCIRDQQASTPLYRICTEGSQCQQHSPPGTALLGTLASRVLPGSWPSGTHDSPYPC